MSLLKKLAGETAMYGMSSILGRFLNYLLVPIYSRMLTKPENGTITELYAYSAFFTMVLSYRMESALFRYGTDESGREKAYATAVWSILGSTAILLAAVMALSQPLANVLDYAQHPEYIRWFALMLAFDCVAEMPFALLRLEQRPRRFVAGKLLNIGVILALNLFWLVFCPWAAQNGMDWVHAVWSEDIRVGYVFISNVIGSAATLLYLSPQLLAANRRLFDAGLWRTMVFYAAPLILVQFAGIVNSMFDRAMQKWLLPGTPTENLADVGIYGNNYKLAMLITIFTQAYRYAAEPFFFRHARDEGGPALQARVTKWFTLVSSLGMLGVLMYLDILKYFLSEPYWVGLYLVPILLLSNVLLGVYYNLSVWYRLKDKTMVGGWISLAGAAITVVMNLLLVPRIGYVGSAWTALGCYALMCFLAWYTGRKHYPAPYAFGRMGAYILGVLVLYGISSWIKTLIPGQLWAMMGINTVLFGVYLAVVYRVEKAEIKTLI